MSKLVTIRRYRDLSEAIVARSLIESSGITAYLYDENLVRLDWQISNFIGGIRLQVELADETEATELLNQSVPDTIYFGTAEAYAQPHCPVCSSTKITFRDDPAKLPWLRSTSSPFPSRSVARLGAVTLAIPSGKTPKIGKRACKAKIAMEGPLLSCLSFPKGICVSELCTVLRDIL